MAVAASFGPPDWKRVEIPEGRTALACRKMYASLTKDVSEATPRKKEAGKPKLRAKKDDSIPLAPKPRVHKRKRNAAGDGYESDGIDDHHGDDGEEEKGDTPVVKKSKSTLRPKNSAN